MYEDQIKYSDITDQVLRPELIKAEARRPCVGENGRGDQSKRSAAECPEIADIEKILILADHHKASENDRPAAYGDGKMINGVGVKIGDTDKTPIIRHFGNYHNKRDSVSEAMLVFASRYLIAEIPNSENYRRADEYWHKVCKSEIFKFNLCSFTEKIMEKIFHNMPSEII
jgi:hypothetical protein